MGGVCLFVSGFVEGSLALAVRCFCLFFRADLNYCLEMSWRFPKSFPAPHGRLGELLNANNVVEKV